VEYAEGDDEGTLQVVPTNWVKLDKKSGGLHVVFLAKDPAALCACDPSVDIGTNETLLGVIRASLPPRTAAPAPHHPPPLSTIVWGEACGDRSAYPVQHAASAENAVVHVHAEPAAAGVIGA